MKKHLYTAMSLGLVISAILMIFFWELYLDEKLNTVSVVVAMKNLDKNAVIKNGDVKIEKVSINLVVDKPITNPAQLIGWETSQFIPKGNQIVEQMIDKYGLEPNADQLIYSIPKEWIYSSPGSLRRKDKVYIYPIPNPDKNNEIRNYKSRFGPDNSAAGKYPFSQTTNSQPILQNIVVAFAKDSANHEVKPVTNSDKRTDATGSISNLELVMSEAQYSVLERKFLDGYRFNFAYR